MVVTGNTEILGGRVRKALEQNKRSNEDVLFCLKGSYGQAIVALDKRLLIIKGGFMAGSTFGCRVSSFYYKDITSVEVNTGLVSGIIEICTPSNQGNKEKDYWARGKDRDPWKVSNCFPIVKSDLKHYQPYLEKIQTFIDEAKHGSSHSTDDVASQIEKLHNLYQSGALTKTEFENAKKKLIS